MDFDIQYFDILDSTNSYLYELGKIGEKEGTVVIAKQQTAGKGRSGRTFISPEGNLYMSLLLRPNLAVDMLKLLTPMCAVCVVNAIYDVFKIRCYIKWVNDIYYNKKKICGILTELNLKSNLADFAVIGIGVNVFNNDFGEELSKTAGSLLDCNESKLYSDKDLIIKKLSEAILFHFNNMYNTFNIGDFMDEYRKYSLIIGKEVTYYTEAEENTVTVLNIEDDGSLKVIDSDGDIRYYSDGEIRIKI